ncbi:arsenate reductase (glutaredoxin) [Rhodovulum imhoffii]|nr:arsenate reductase (glutaredoxin) [Rhodovulum imhoffii]
MTIWHNPRCSKSRAALRLIEAQGHTPAIRLYRDDAPTPDELRAALETLGIRAIEMIRTAEARFTELGLSASDDGETLLRAMADNPTLIERPVVFAGGRAVIARPPERVLELL